VVLGSLVFCDFRVQKRKEMMVERDFSIEELPRGNGDQNNASHVFLPTYYSALTLMKQG
jgi:hypothetical protein